MKRVISGLGALLLLTVTATSAMAWEYGEGVFNNSQWAGAAGASYYYVTDQTVNLWGDNGNGRPVAVDTRDNDDVTVIQGPDQNWSGTGIIQPGAINYENFLGAPDRNTSGYGGNASGGSLVVAFDRDIVNGNDDVIGQNRLGNEVNYGGIDFMVHGFGFCFNEAFSAERGTINIYAATADYNPTISVADPDGPGPLGEVTITGDESQWVLLSEYTGYVEGAWIGNPNMDYTSGPGQYGQFLWGDLSDGGLETARYLKFELGDGGHFINQYTGAESNNGRALFIDAVEARAVPVPGAVWLLGSGLLGLVGLRKKA
ncbi:MAG: hypothetical protein PVG39_10405 [Desulfobacteraceae bacterium]